MNIRTSLTAMRMREDHRRIVILPVWRTINLRNVRKSCSNKNYVSLLGIYQKRGIKIKIIIQVLRKMKLLTCLKLNELLKRVNQY